MTPADQIFAFMLAAFPKHEGHTTQRAWFDWYWRDGRVFATRSGGKIVAAALARCVDNAHQGMDEPATHRDGAPLLWITLGANTAGPRGWEAIIRMMGQRFGQLPQSVAFHRSGRPDRIPRILPTSTYFRRMTNGQI